MIDPSLLSPTALEVLTASGWTPGRDVGTPRLAQWRLRYAVVHGGVSEASAVECWNAAADELLRTFGGLKVVQSGAGVDLARNCFDLDPLLLVPWTRLIARRGEALGTVLAPLGRVENRAAIVVSADAQVMLIDHTGEWAYEAGLERGLSDLIDGVLPPLRYCL